MSAWTAIAAKDAAVITSLGNGILHGISPGALDGFAVGTMLTGLCFLVIVAQRSLRRSRLSARPGVWPSFIRRPRIQRDYYAEAADPGAEPLLASSEDDIAAAAGEQDRPEGGRGYRSKHRMTDHEPGERRGEGRRSAPKHAAPSSRFGSRMSGKLTMFPLAAARG